MKIIDIRSNIIYSIKLRGLSWIDSDCILPAGFFAWQINEPAWIGLKYSRNGRINKLPFLYRSLKTSLRYKKRTT
jgi:hypothetical protein